MSGAGIEAPDSGGTGRFVAPQLAELGLQLQAALPMEDLDGDVVDALIAGGVDVARYASLVMFGHAGSLLWERVVRHELGRPDPFDDSVAEIVDEWLTTHHPDAGWEIVYPGRSVLPLGRLAEVAGWGRPSPLGLTIHPEFGLWIAHRMAVVTSVGFDVVPGADREHPCDTCDGRPCERACPVSAVSYETGFDVMSCGTHRIAPASECAYRCLARNACPVGAQHRYGDDQMRYHYGIGLSSIREWLGGDGTAGPAS